MASFDVPSDALGKQHSASNPDQSVWVSANAGSGKTHVLASRVIRLLLQGVAPIENPLPDVHQGRRREHGFGCLR